MIRKKKNETTGPRITFELVGGDQLQIITQWPKEDNLQMFASLLAYLCQGKLTNIIDAAVGAQAMKNGEPEKRALVHAILQQIKAQSQHTEEGPLVCPTQAIRMNMMPFGQ